MPAIIAELSLSRAADQKKKDKKIWLSMRPRNFRSDKIVRVFVPLLMLADVKCLTSLKVQGI